jgi:DNA-binding response OmpR family regulator
VEESGMPDDALRKLDKGGFDAVLMDVRMPGMNGMELYGTVSTRWPAMAHRVIIITGDSSDTTIKQFLTSNGIPYVSKPFDRTTLEERLNSILSERQTPV